MSRSLLGPSTPLTTVWIAFDRMEGGSTSVGPFGFRLTDVRSAHAVLAISAAARTLRIWYLMIGLLFPSGYGRTDRVKPMLRAVGNWPFSTPCRLPVSNPVSGSIVGCFAQSSRLRPTSAMVACEKPIIRATDGGML